MVISFCFTTLQLAHRVRGCDLAGSQLVQNGLALFNQALFLLGRRQVSDLIPSARMTSSSRLRRLGRRVSAPGPPS